jgi:two-component SAPR family response regulator
VTVTRFPISAVAIGDRHQAAGRLTEAEVWYRRALEHTPLHSAATRGLARVLRESGDAEAAERLCRELEARLGSGQGCGVRD